MLMTTYYHENISLVTIKSSTIAFGSAVQGGGMNIWIEVRQLRLNSLIACVITFLSVITVLETVFMNNSASDGGGGVFINYFERSITDTIQQHISIIHIHKAREMELQRIFSSVDC